MPLLLSTADTDLLAARAAEALLPDELRPLLIANPVTSGDATSGQATSGQATSGQARSGQDVSAYGSAGPGSVAQLFSRLRPGADFVLVRLLGGKGAWPEGFDALRAACQQARVPLVALGGEAAPDAELLALSTVASGVVIQAAAYLTEGGPANLAALLRFLSDTLLLTGHGFDPPLSTPMHGIHVSAVHGPRAQDPVRATVGVVFYRAHELSGNTGFVDVLCDAVEAKGANALPVFVPSLRPDPDGRIPAVEESLAGKVDALIVTVLASGGSNAGDTETWDAGALAALDVPLVQGLCLTSSRQQWQDSDAAISPLDAAMQVAIPEFDGRLISVPFSFKETGPDGVPIYVADAERAARVAGIATRLATLRRKTNAEKKIALVLSSYPTKHARVGNAVGLDTPASAVVLLKAMRAAGYDVGEFPEDSDELIHTLIAAGGHDVEWLTEEQLAGNKARVPLATYEKWFAELPDALRDGMLRTWGAPPGGLYVDDGDIVVACLQFGKVVLAIQPPRGFGENPIAIYHDPALPPSHHYLAAYRWLDREFGADAVVHLGKHGTLEWLPGKGLGLSASCAPDAVLGDLPLVYPFIVNDPGEGTQAKRRGHATIVDHLVPPMARADTYNELAKLEQLLDEHASVAALDPIKLPVIRAQIWELVTAAQLHHDLHVDEAPAEEDFDEFLLHVDGYLCEIKDVQIRDGLHILGGAPEGEPLVNLVLGVLRAEQTWAGDGGAVPGLRRALSRWSGLDEKALLAEPGAQIAVPARLSALLEGPARTAADAVDLIEGVARRLVERLHDAGWDPQKVPAVVEDILAEQVPEVLQVLNFAATVVVPRLARTTDEIDHLLHALEGGYVPAGPSGSPTRGLVGVLPTGRNFYSVDPKAIPSRLAWTVGVALAESLLARYRQDNDGAWPQSVGLVVWGTSAMRTAGDDIAEILWLLGCRPVWDEASRRVSGFEVVPADELGRPRIDVTVRISGFFRDAFPHVVQLIDDAVSAVAALADEPDEDNFVAAHARADAQEHGDWRRATTRVFGSKPGAYGAGLLPLIDSRDWRTDADLAEVYAVWGGYAYGRGLDGREARGDMEAVYRRVTVAAKNQDNREHDIVDSDDYFQYHGGMVAAVRALTGSNPAAYVGDSATPDAVKTRTLAEETKRVFRARVVNPRWIAAMQRHGYKGAFEMSATVDYLFGYDATAGVVDDWMYERLSAEYVFDDTNRAFMAKSNPWALRGIAERLLEAAERGLWAEPEQGTLQRLRQTYLDLEGDLEGE